jgi:serine/threonine protein phosphatase PrpC
MRFLPGNAQHIGARQSQQDSFGFTDLDDAVFMEHGGFVAVVCDGMGGMEHGDAAAKTAVRTFLEAYRQKTPMEPIPAALERSVRAANYHVVELARSFGVVEGMGTTLVAAAFKGSGLYYISVGDSGLFHTCYGQLQRINQFHLFANMLDVAVARGQMTQEAALAHPERESLTSYIGTTSLEEIDQNLEAWPLQDGDTVLLATDGMFKTLTTEEMLACLSGDPPTWPEALVERVVAKQREFQDNVTVLSVTLDSENKATIPRTIVRRPAEPETPYNTMLPDDYTITQVMRAAGPPSTMPPVEETPPPLPPPVLPAPAPYSPETLIPDSYSAPPESPWNANQAPAGISAPAQRARRGGLWIAVAGIVLFALLAIAWWFWAHRSAEGLAAPPPAVTEPDPRADSGPRSDGPAPPADPNSPAR